MEGSKDQNNSPAEGRARSYSAVSQSCGYTGKYAYLDRLVPIQRKYCRSVLNSKEKTYKGLSVWLKPSVFQLQSAMEEEDAYITSSSR